MMCDHTIPNICRRCCEAGADRAFDAQRGDIAYRCWSCRHYKPRLRDRIGGWLRDLRHAAAGLFHKGG